MTTTAGFRNRSQNQKQDWGNTWHRQALADLAQEDSELAMARGMPTSGSSDHYNPKYRLRSHYSHPHLLSPCISTRLSLISPGIWCAYSNRNPRPGCRGHCNPKFQVDYHLRNCHLARRCICFDLEHKRSSTLLGQKSTFDFGARCNPRVVTCSRWSYHHQASLNISSPQLQKKCRPLRLVMDSARGLGCHSNTQSNMNHRHPCMSFLMPSCSHNRIHRARNNAWHFVENLLVASV